MINLKKYRTWCLNNKYPIMADESLEYICQQINLNNFKTMFEIGTCVAYSTLYFSQNSRIEKVDSIERDIERHLIAKEKILSCQDTKIKLIYDDALNYYPLYNYDLMLFDAAKAQNQAFLNHYLPYLKINGIIFIDNIYFHHISSDDNSVSSKTRKMVSKLEQFIIDIKNNSDFIVSILDLGDGLMIIKRVSDK